MGSYSAILTLTCLTPLICSGVFCVSHDTSLHYLGDNAPLLFQHKTSQSESSILSVELDYGTEETGKFKADLARQFQKEKENKDILVEVDVDLSTMSLSVNKHQLKDKDGHIIADDNCLTFSMMADLPSTPLKACVKLEQGVHWYNAFQIYFQDWPMEKMKIERHPMITDERENHAVAEPYFLNSKGQFIYLSPQMTTFYSLSPISSPEPKLCFYSEIVPPYYRPSALNNFMNFTLCHYENPRTAHRKAVQYFLGKPRAMPDVKMVQYPIWTTWAQYKTRINSTTLIEYANDIKNHGFSNSQLEIDDNWEVCYGSEVIDSKSFPNMKDTITQLNSLGYRTTIWVHPFINKDCTPYYNQYKAMDLLVVNIKGNDNTQWWNSGKGEAAHFDFSKPRVRDWYFNRLEVLRKKTGLDSFKLDAGESSFAPQVPILSCPEERQPGCLSTAYLENAARLGPMIEFRTGAQTQHLPNYIRMIDRETYWDLRCGLGTLIPTLLMLNMAGYPFVMPDIICGNEYQPGTCTEELYIRWTQANVFMPIMQFSIPPWRFSDETVQIVHKFVLLHTIYSDKIVSAMSRAVTDGTPVNLPLWWIAPSDPVALACGDEYLLGEDILVAPVLTKGAVARDIYLPKGQWKDAIDPEQVVYNGPKWLKNYPAPIDVLPYFLKVQNSSPSSSSSSIYLISYCFILFLFLNYFSF
uniref:Uncharacterized family 31 glucosidase KIAA1161 n=1 Tax=Cacopsylla melanoneura TaxID=428564 RepID=A0A8D8TIF4_9HEMI